MSKHKLTTKQIINVVIISILYVTWIVGIHVLMQISGNEDRHIIYSNLLGSFLALIFAIMLHYPLIPLFSKYVNARTENEVVALRRSYAIKVLYTIIIGFFISVFLMFLGYDNKEEYPFVAAINLVVTAAGIMTIVFTVLTLQYMKRMKTILYVDKLQHKNADIEG